MGCPMNYLLKNSSWDFLYVLNQVKLNKKPVLHSNNNSQTFPQKANLPYMLKKNLLKYI
jgi:hypothetical protein